MKITKAQLRQRLIDLATGAHAGLSWSADFDSDDFPGMANDMGLDGFGRWIAAIVAAFIPEPDYRHLVSMHNLEYFDSIQKATDHLWDNRELLGVTKETRVF